LRSSVSKLIEELGGYGEVRVLRKGLIHLKACREDLPKIAELLHWGLGGYFSVSVGVDERPVDGLLHVYHVFSIDELGTYVVVEASVSPAHPRMPSITPVVDAANWHEREVTDFIGVEFVGHPEPGRLILPYDWPEGVYPLRKDFPYDSKVSVGEVPDEVVVDEKGLEGYTKLPVGPYHPALHEPEHFILYVDGERVVDARYKGFFIYRGIEKVAESRLTVNQVPFIAERICGICGYTHSCCYCQAVESAAGIEVPERALYIRSTLLEIERIHSHMLWLGVAFHVLGFDTGFMIMMRVREAVMSIAEMLTGNRKTYGMNLVGGVRRDINEGRKEVVLRALRRVREEFRESMEDILRMREIVSRTKGVGVLTYNDARRLSVLGPVARASGIDTDVRKRHPYAAYKHVDFRIPVYRDGDVLSRLLVRYEEVLESIGIVEQLLESMPRGEILCEEVEIPEYRKGVGATEAPRGEDIHFVITGRDNKVYRWKPRAPSYNNIPSTIVMLRGERLADAPVIIASNDPCFSCTDHLVVIDVRRGVRKVVRGEELARRW